MNQPKALNSVICVSCGKKLAEALIQEGKFSIICSKCGVENTIESKIIPRTSRTSAVK